MFCIAELKEVLETGFLNTGINASYPNRRAYGLNRCL